MNFPQIWKKNLNRGENNNIDEDKLVTENEPDKPEERGIISIVQSPDEVKNKENE